MSDKNKITKTAADEIYKRFLLKNRKYKKELEDVDPKIKREVANKIAESLTEDEKVILKEWDKEDKCK